MVFRAEKFAESSAQSGVAQFNLVPYFDNMYERYMEQLIFLLRTSISQKWVLQARFLFAEAKSVGCMATNTRKVIVWNIECGY